MSAVGTSSVCESTESNDKKNPVDQQSSSGQKTIIEEKLESEENNKCSNWLQKTRPSKRRDYCDRCLRPKPRACICESLPEESITLSKCRILVLQHPLEGKMKNRSVPLLQLTLSPKCMMVTVGRRFGDQTSSTKMMDIINDEKEPLLLLYPSPDALPLEKVLQSMDVAKHETVNILVLDATWKYAREMDRANTLNDQYPTKMIRVKLDPSDKHLPTTFRPRRFDIRTPPSPDHLSTAECIAWAVSRIENNSALYEILLKPLDCMVTKWKSFSTKKQKTNHKIK